MRTKNNEGAKQRLALTTKLAAWLATCLIGCAVQAADLGYDSDANPFDGYRDAIAQAREQHKLVLVVAGGDWCYWCRVLDNFVTRDAHVQRNLKDAFVVVKVYVGERNFNELFFSQLPKASGAPYFWVVSPDREVLSAQSTRPFEAHGDRYDKSKFLEFVRHWKQQAVANRRPKPVADAS